jgi:serine/threonine-protein kinase
MNERLLRHWPRVERLLDELEQLSGEEQTKRLDALAGQDSELAAAVQDFRAAELNSVGFLDTPATPFPAAGSNAPLDRIDHYRLVEELGRGGMSTVYVAERDDGAFSQRVAVKLLDTSARSPEARERFRRERMILARLRHPNVAQLFDGGETESGALYLVMELVDGMRIDEWADRARLITPARLRLFLQVCAAVEYAHSQLVIHRDIKPGNVLVDLRGTVKLLDFGIAKLTEEEPAADAPVATITRVLTPGYAAPEQFRAEAATAATDVYQLGLLLYELLCGHRAHGTASSTFDLLHDAVLSREPIPPSCAALTGASIFDSGSWQTLSADQLATHRGCDAGTLSRQLSGDLDAIVMRALRKEPAARYQTVEALRRDIENYLAYLPVEARRGDWTYRTWKSLRRHRSLFTAAGAAGCSLVLGLVGVLTQSRAAAVERDRARDAESRASAINDFLVNELLQAARPEGAEGQEPTVSEVLSNASRAVGVALGEFPATEGEVRLALARSYMALGRLDQAQVHIEAAIAQFAKLGAPGNPSRLRSRALLVDLRLRQGRVTDARTAVDPLIVECQAQFGPEHRESLAVGILEARVTGAEGHAARASQQLRVLSKLSVSIQPDTWRLRAELLEALADALSAQYHADEAEAVSLEALEILERHLGPDHPASIGALRRLAKARDTALKWAEALELYREVLARRLRAVGPDHPDTGGAWQDLSVIYSRLDRHPETHEAVDRALATYQATLGPDHPRTLGALRNRAVLLSQAGDHSQAEQIYRRLVEVRTRTLGAAHPATIRAWRDRLINLQRAGRESESRESARAIIAAFDTATGAADADPVLLDNFAEFLLDVEPAEFRDAARALAIAERAVEATARTQYLPLKTMARALERLGDHPLAIATTREALALPEAIRSWTTEDQMVSLLRAHGTDVELESFLIEQVDRHRRLRGDDEPLMAKSLRHLGQLYARLGRNAEAEQRFRESLDQLRKTRPEHHWEVARAKSELGEALHARGATIEAEPLLVQAYESLAADPSAPPQLLVQARERLARLKQR